MTWNAAILGLVLAVSIGVLAIVVDFTQSVVADHETPNKTEFWVVGRSWEPDDFGRAKATTRARGVPAIARSVVDFNDNQPLKVCSISQNNYELATKMAVDKWNDGLRESGIVGKSGILKWVEGGLGNCPVYSDTSVASIVIVSVSDNRPCPLTSDVACAQPFGVRGDPFYTFTGRAEVRFNEGSFETEFPFDDGDLTEEIKQKSVVIAHEIGHILGFRHVWEDVGRDPPRCPDEVNDITVIDPSFKSIMLGHGCASDDLTHHDVMAYSDVYSPASVAQLSADSADNNAVSFLWSATDVHVEKGFQIQQKVLQHDGSVSWVSVGSAVAANTSPSTTSPHTLTGVLGGPQTFRVLSLTDALIFTTDEIEAFPTVTVDVMPWRELTTVVSPPGAGTIDPKPGTRYGKGATVTVQTWPTDASWEFVQWTESVTGASESSVSPEGVGSSYQVTMSAHKTVTAVYRKKAVAPPPTEPTDTPTAEPTDTPTTEPSPDPCPDPNAASTPCPTDTPAPDPDPDPDPSPSPSPTTTPPPPPPPPPTWSWAGSCYDGKGTVGVGFGLPSSAAAHAAGQAFVASCPVGGAASNVLGTTRWYATITCNNGTKFTIGPYSTAGAASSAAQFALITCSAGSPFADLSLPPSPMTSAQLEEAMLAALPTPLTLKDLTQPVIPEQTALPPARGSFTTSEADGKHHAAVTCDDGRKFTVGPSKTLADAVADGLLGLRVCASDSLAKLPLPESGAFTRAELESAMTKTLAALATPLTLADLTPPAIPGAAGTNAPARAGGFATTIVDGEEYTDVTCDDGRSFTVGPSATLADAIDAGLLGLRVCANGDTLANLKLPESGAITRARLESSMTAVLAALPGERITFDALRAPPSGLQFGETVIAQSGSYTTWSQTTWSWSASCRLSSASGSGSGYSTQSAASSALLLWLATANCPAGGGTYSIAQE